MARPHNDAYRVAILGAFDKHSIRSIKEVCNHLQQVGEFKSYNSTRRMLIKLAKEGLITELPQKANKNAIQYSKLVFNTSAKLITYDKDVVDLGQFIYRLVNKEFPEVIDSQASIVIKHWLLDALASSYPDGYMGKRDVPDPELIKKRLEGTLTMLREFHTFLKNFLESGVFSPVARPNLAEDFMKHYSHEHVIIVEGLWENATRKSDRGNE